MKTNTLKQASSWCDENDKWIDAIFINKHFYFDTIKRPNGKYTLIYGESVNDFLIMAAPLVDENTFSKYKSSMNCKEYFVGEYVHEVSHMYGDVISYRRHDETLSEDENYKFPHLDVTMEVLDELINLGFVNLLND